jgi:hypothetical protein
MVHLISYELKGRYRHPFEYERLANEIKSISGVWCHLPESKWLIETEISTREVAERLAPLTQLGDPLFVTRIYRDWSSYSLTQEQIEWLNGRNYSSLWEALQMLVSLPKPVASALSNINPFSALARPKG